MMACHASVEPRGGVVDARRSLVERGLPVDKAISCGDELRAGMSWDSDRILRRSSNVVDPRNQDADFDGQQHVTS